MNIKLDMINSGVVDDIEIKQVVKISKDYYDNSDIKDLKNIFFDGKIYRNSADELILEGNITGVMVIEDSISLELVDYDFSINIEEILENDENTIDIIPILWQNIVLEVPLRFTKVSDLSAYSGDGWKLISEGEETKNNPFLELSKNFKEE